VLSCVVLQVLCNYNFYDSSGLEEGGREGGMIIESGIYSIT